MTAPTRARCEPLVGARVVLGLRRSRSKNRKHANMIENAPGSGLLSAADETYASLRRMILERKLRPGQRLLEPELSSTLGVSRTPLREAVRRLQGDGLVTLRGRGAFVSVLSTNAIHELYLFRAAVEGFTAELAAGRHQQGELAPSQIASLHGLRAAIEDSGDPRTTAEANLELHRYIAALSGNQFAIDALNRVWDIISISSEVNVADPAWRHTIDGQHRDIVDAIEAGDEAKARSSATEHVKAAAATFLKHALEAAEE